MKTVRQTKLICRCHNVHEEQIEASLKRGCGSFDRLLSATKAGSGCGTCISDLRDAYNRYRAVSAIEKHGQLPLAFQILSHKK